MLRGLLRGNEMSDLYQVVEGCGTGNENVVAEFSRFDDARRYIISEYYTDEIIYMNVDILKNGSNEF